MSLTTTMWTNYRGAFTKIVEGKLPEVPSLTLTRHQNDSVEVFGADQVTNIALAIA